MKNVCLFLFLSSMLSSFAQDFDFGKISKEELQEKSFDLDSSSNAAYLYKYRRTYFDYQLNEGFKLITEIHERIKIYNNEGFDYATKKVYLYKDGSDKEKIIGLKGYTYNLVDGSVEETKLKKDGIFDNETSNYYDQTSFTMPDVKEGSVIEYKYTVVSPFLSNVDEFKFQHDIPIKKLEASFEAPEYFNFKVNMKGYLAVNPKNELGRDRIMYTGKNRSTGRNTSYESNDIEYIKNITRYSMTNVMALKEEPYVNNIDNYRSSAKFELSYTHFPNSTIDYYSTTWEDVIKSIYRNTNFGDELNKSGYYDNEVSALISNVSDPAQRAILIFDFVKSRVKWNDYYGKYTNVGVRKAYNEGVGNVAEINLMLTSMLRFANLDAYPVLVSTRTNGVPLFPTREGYDYVISYVNLPNGGLLLDATSEFSVPNVLPFRTLNWEGRIIKKDGTSTLINLYPNEKSKNSADLLIDLKSTGTIEGKYRVSMADHSALSFRNGFNHSDQDNFIEKIENKFDGLEISDFKVVNADKLSKPVMESYSFTKENQADVIGDNIFFSPLFFFSTNENPFKSEKREFPIDFGYPTSSSYRVIINLPEGYAVESLPEPKALQLDEYASFSYQILNNGPSIQLMVNAEINSSIIPAEYYPLLKEYYKQIIDKQNEKIVLKKV